MDIGHLFRENFPQKWATFYFGQNYVENAVGATEKFRKQLEEEKEEKVAAASPWSFGWSFVVVVVDGVVFCFVFVFVVLLCGSDQSD